ncbi:MAG: hypothetical protein JXB49_31050 [Bacteroidales bacterium]|nr:hypothetical protein [Bacteroidales bacterium]MBN2820722.1 hypothetical protein [Bacteroidales bacterium]
MLKSYKKVLFSLALLVLLINIIDNNNIIKLFSIEQKLNKADVLIIEGWLNQYNNNAILNIIKQHNYKAILIVGRTSLEKNIFLFMNGDIIIKNFENINFTTKNNFVLHLGGSKSKHAFTFTEIYKNDSLVTAQTIKRNTEVVFNSNWSSSDSLVIKFTNDARDKYSDRNLVLKNCFVNENRIELLSDKNFVSYWHSYQNTDYETNSELIKNYLVRSQITNIEILPTSRKGISKTYNSAYEAITRIKNQGYTSANIVTADYHSRRTFLSYKKADKNFDMGVIALNEQSHKGRIRSKLRIVKELFGSMFIKIVPKAILESHY